MLVSSESVSSGDERPDSKRNLNDSKDTATSRLAAPSGHSVSLTDANLGQKSARECLC